MGNARTKLEYQSNYLTVDLKSQSKQRNDGQKLSNMKG